MRMKKFVAAAVLAGVAVAGIGYWATQKSGAASTTEPKMENGNIEAEPPTESASAPIESVAQPGASKQTRAEASSTGQMSSRHPVPQTAAAAKKPAEPE